MSVLILGGRYFAVHHDLSIFVLEAKFTCSLISVLQCFEGALEPTVEAHVPSLPVCADFDGVYWFLS